MHEMGLVLQAIDELKEVCEANDVTRLISKTTSAPAGMRQ